MTSYQYPYSAFAAGLLDLQQFSTELAIMLAKDPSAGERAWQQLSVLYSTMQLRKTDYDQLCDLIRQTTGYVDTQSILASPLAYNAEQNVGSEHESQQAQPNNAMKQANSEFGHDQHSQIQDDETLIHPSRNSAYQEVPFQETRQDENSPGNSASVGDKEATAESFANSDPMPSLDVQQTHPFIPAHSLNEREAIEKEKENLIAQPLLTESSLRAEDEKTILQANPLAARHYTEQANRTSESREIHIQQEETQLYRPEEPLQVAAGQAFSAIQSQYADRYDEPTAINPHAQHSAPPTYTEQHAQGEEAQSDASAKQNAQDAFNSETHAQPQTPQTAPKDKQYSITNPPWHIILPVSILLILVSVLAMQLLNGSSLTDNIQLPDLSDKQYEISAVNTTPNTLESDSATGLKEFPPKDKTLLEPLPSTHDTISKPPLDVKQQVDAILNQNKANTSSQSETVNNLAALATGSLTYHYSAVETAIANRKIEPLSDPDSALSHLDRMIEIDNASPEVRKARIAIAQAYLQKAKDARVVDQWKDAESFVDKAIMIRSEESMPGDL